MIRLFTVPKETDEKPSALALSQIKEFLATQWEDFDVTRNLRLAGSFVDNDGAEYSDLVFYPKARFLRAGEHFFTDGTFLISTEDIIDAVERAFAEDTW